MPETLSDWLLAAGPPALGVLVLAPAAWAAALSHARHGSRRGAVAAGLALAGLLALAVGGGLAGRARAGRLAAAADADFRPRLLSRAQDEADRALWLGLGAGLPALAAFVRGERKRRRRAREEQFAAASGTPNRPSRLKISEPAQPPRSPGPSGPG